jgi:hypothetical protein
MIFDKVWKLTNTVRVGLDAQSSHVQRQSTFPDKGNDKRMRERVTKAKGITGLSRMMWVGNL